MAIEATTVGFARNSAADTVLRVSARLWFGVAVAGQVIFASYIIAFYGGALALGNLEAWNQVLPNGYVAGATVGNVVVGLHVLLAAIITLGGPLQLVPAVRAKAPVFHRWNGRVYLLTAVVVSVTGLFMVLTRGAVGGTVQHLSISFNAVLILVCAAMAVRYALARDFRTHRRWALRLFLVVSGVWFFRVGLMFWIGINGGPVGFDPSSFEGPALIVLGVGQYLLPLGVLELYLRAQDKPGGADKYAVSALLGVLTLAMAIGIAVATMGMWLPRM
ncbi:DUF2306 domain-containing protein [Lysobacter sp. D1-1-M9]|uniref:DUF2306 domain-containing protein n=2 Tax=Novilysobacter TaxID=3382699 RepID=UPI002FC92980